jgi:glycosyltransferase involved in cell wall biosynthesis
MHVLLAATSYPRDSSDWKGRFIHDQAAALARQAARVSLWAPPGELPPKVQSALHADDAGWLDDLLDAGGIAQLLRRRPLAGVWAGAQLLRRLRRACRLASADFYLINWLQNALALPDDGRPAIVTVLGSDFRLLGLPGMRFALRRQFRRRATLLAPNADWMAPRLQALFGDVARVEAIPFGVDARWFAVERKLAEPRRWLVVSRLTPGKIGDLFAWGEGRFEDGRELHLFGPMQENLSVPAWVHYHGATCPAALCDEWFPKAAGLITLSRHDEGRPQVMLEAMATGLPVIASDLPAHRDLIRHRETGWLVGSREAFHQAMHDLEAPDNNRNIGQAARRWVKATVGDWDDCAARYMASGEALLRERPPS